MKQFYVSEYHNGFFAMQNYSVYSYLREIKNPSYDFEDPENENPHDYAEVFISGACNEFAYALHEAFGYEIYEIRHNRDCHWFAKASYLGKTMYIDVRGATSDFEGEFLLNLPFIFGNEYSISHQDLCKEDLQKDDDYYESGLSFANWIISTHKELYCFSNE